MRHYFDIEHSISYGSFPFKKLEEYGIDTVLLEDKGMKQRIRIFISDEGEDATPNNMLVTAYAIGCLVEMFRKK